MIYTPGIMALSEPEYGDDADIAVINSNSVKIDDHMTNAFNNIAEPFDTTKAYEVGEIVVYEKVTYIFTAAKSAGAWDATKVEVKPLGTAIFEKEGGGASSLSDLTDTDIDTPVEGEVLTWNGEDWVNAEGTPAVTKTATGNPIEITDGADAPLVKCMTQIQGSQDLHGQNKPWVGGAGKNKLPLVLADIKSANASGTWSGNTYTIYNVTFTVNTDNDGNVTSITVNGTASANVDFKLAPSFTLTAGSYIASNEGSGTSYYGQIENGSTWSSRIVTNSPQTISYNSDGVIYHFYVSNSSNVSNVEIHPMLRLSTVTDSTFAPYSNICPITAYTEGEIEVRGELINSSFEVGSLDTNASKLSAGNRLRTSEFYSLKANSNYTIEFSTTAEKTVQVSYQFWSKNTFGNNTRLYDSGWNESYPVIVSPTDDCYLTYLVRYSDNSAIATSEVTSTIKENTTTHTTTYPSAIYRGSEDVVNGEVTEVLWKRTLKWGDGYSTSVIGNYTRKQFDVPLTVYPPSDLHPQLSSCAPYKASYAEDSLHFYVNNATSRPLVMFLPNDMSADFEFDVVAELATPTTTPVTPTNLPIKSLSGYNHIESSTGDMEVEYITQGYQPLVDLIEANSGKHVYSTEEKVVGTWIDGKTIYEKTYTNATEQSVSYQTWTPTVISTTDIDRIVNLFTTRDADGGTYIPVVTRKENGYVEIFAAVGWTYNNITIQYTKTSSNNRSLSKGATDSLRAEISEVKGEGEELTETDEKAVKKAQSESIETKVEADETEENADEVQNETVTE